MNLEARVDKLERDNKTLKKMLGGVAALALAALIGGTVLGVHAADGNFNTITAKSILLNDSSGKIRVGMQGTDGSLYLFDSSGKERIKLEGSAGSLYLNNSTGTKKIKLDGTNGLIKSISYKQW